LAKGCAADPLLTISLSLQAANRMDKIEKYSSATVENLSDIIFLFFLFPVLFSVANKF